MKKINFYTLLFTVFIFACAGLNTKMTGTWQNENLLTSKDYRSVFIDVMGPNIATKNMLENELAFRASNKGIKVTKSHDIFKNKFSDGQAPSKSELLDLIKSTNSETIFTVALKNKETTTRYVPGNNYYAPMGYGYYGNYYPYYSNFYSMAYDPGYYKEDQVYYVESNLYDTETEELIWSAQSKTYNPSNSEDFVKGYTQALIDQLVKDGVIKNTE